MFLCSLMLGYAAGLRIYNNPSLPRSRFWMSRNAPQKRCVTSNESNAGNPEQ